MGAGLGIGAPAVSPSLQELRLCARSHPVRQLLPQSQQPFHIQFSSWELLFSSSQIFLIDLLIPTKNGHTHPPHTLLGQLCPCAMSPQHLGACLWVSVAVKRHHDDGNSYEGKHLIRVACLQFRGSAHYHHDGTW